MSGHTPGPWIAVEDAGRAEAEGKDGFFPWLVESASCTVAGVTGIGGAEAAANASLFAVAPELLARVKARFAWCDCGSSRAGVAVCDDCKADSVVIAKAESR